MFKLLFKYVIPLGLFLATGLVGYNYFFGTPTEQENSKQIIAKVRGLGSDVFSLLASEKEKFHQGKYDNAIDKIGSSLSYLKQQAGGLAAGGQQFLQQINVLEAEKRQLEKQLEYFQQNSNSTNGVPVNARASGGAGITQTYPEEQLLQRIRELAQQTEDLGMRLGNN